MYLLSLCALLSQQAHVFLICVVCWRTMIPGKIFTSFAKFQGIVSVNDFRLPIRLQELHQVLLGLLGSFCIHCVAKSCTTTAYRVIVSRFTFFAENSVIRCNQVSKMFRSGHECTSTSSARSPCYFRLHADIAIWVLRKVRMCAVLTRTRFHFCSRLHWNFMRRLGSVLTSLLWASPRLCWSTVINPILSEFL